MSANPIDVLRRARADAVNISDKASGRALYRILKNAEDDLAARIVNHKQLRPGMDGTFTRTQMEVTLAQIRAVLRTVVDKLGMTIPDAAVDAAGQAADGVTDYLGAAEKKFTGINSPLALDDAAMSDAAIAGTRASVVRRLMVEHPDGRGGGVLQRYGFAVAERFEKQFQTALLTRKPWAEIRSSLVDASPFLKQAPAFWAERVARTEMMGAYNRGGHEAMKVAQNELGDMIRIVVATFDERTGGDSYNVHGQIRRMEEPFEYVNYEGEHESFMTPPNRPNDREIVVAHRASWPIPEAFRPKSDGEVHARYRQQKQEYHGRPKVMSTLTLPASPAPKVPDDDASQADTAPNRASSDAPNDVPDGADPDETKSPGEDVPPETPEAPDEPEAPDAPDESEEPALNERVKNADDLSSATRETISTAVDRGGFGAHLDVSPLSAVEEHGPGTAKRPNPAGLYMFGPESGSKISISDVKNATAQFGRRWQNVPFDPPTEPGDPNLFKISQLATSPEDMRARTLVHELSHHLHIDMKNPLSRALREEISDAYKIRVARTLRAPRKGKWVPSQYATFDEREWFAEVHSTFVHYPETLAKEDPDAFDLMKRVRAARGILDP